MRIQRSKLFRGCVCGFVVCGVGCDVFVCVAPCRLSESLLQGFTCTSAQTLSEQRVKELVKACRHRPGRQKIQLRESQVHAALQTSERSFIFRVFCNSLLLWPVVDVYV